MQENLPTFYVKKTPIDEVNFREIDFDLYDELGFDSEKQDFKEIEDHFQDTRAHPINIDRMITALVSLKRSDVTHIEIIDNLDSIGYTIYGYEIRLANSDEIENFLNAESIRLEKLKEARISYHKRELAKALQS